VLALLRRRASLYLVGAALVWTLGGALILWWGFAPGLASPRLERSWLVGVALGAAFLLVHWLRQQPKVSRWLKLSMALLTFFVFAKALWDFWRRYG
jgi:hypothetical protein